MEWTRPGEGFHVYVPSPGLHTGRRMHTSGAAAWTGGHLPMLLSRSVPCSHCLTTLQSLTRGR
jgi:hypothetical protein